MAQIVFRQLGTTGLSTFIKTGRNGRLIYTDPKKGRRKIRYCSNEESVFVEEQSEFAVSKALRLIYGEIKVNPDDKPLLKFLRIHPDNAANGGRLFMEINEEQEAVDGLFLEDLIVDLKAEAKKAQKTDIGYLKLMALAAHIKGSYTLVKDKSAAELRQIVNNEIMARPMAYYNAEKEEAELFNDDIIRSFLALQAVDKGVVKVSPDQRSIKWADEDEIITEVPAGRRAKDYFTEFLGTDAGSLVAKRLEKLV